MNGAFEAQHGRSATFERKSASLSEDFGMQLFRKKFGERADLILTLLGTYTPGARKGLPRGGIRWIKCVEGGWGSPSRDHAVGVYRPGSFDFEVVADRYESPYGFSAEFAESANMASIISALAARDTHVAERMCKIVATEWTREAPGASGDHVALFEDGSSLEFTVRGYKARAPKVDPADALRQNVAAIIGKIEAAQAAGDDAVKAARDTDLNWQFVTPELYAEFAAQATSELAIEVSEVCADLYETWAGRIARRLEADPTDEDDVAHAERLRAVLRAAGRTS